MKKEMTIEGMTCNHCKMRVEKALGTLDGIENVQVNLEAKTATVEMTGDVSDAELREVVEDAGYNVVDIK